MSRPTDDCGAPRISSTWPSGAHMIEHVFLAGVPVPDARVLELARRLEDARLDDQADRLEAAWRREVKVVALDVADREVILRVLEDGPAEFAEHVCVASARGARLKSTTRRAPTGRCGFRARRLRGYADASDCY